MTATTETQLEVEVEPPRRHSVGTAAVIFTSLGSLTLILLFFAAYAFGFSALQEQRSQSQLYAQLRGLLDPSSPLAPPIGGALKPGTPVALLNVPRAGIRNLVVVEGTSSADLLAGPGHQRDTPLPGQPGQSVLMGKSATAGAPFRKVDDLAAGDIITVTTGQGTFHYTVRDLRGANAKLPTITGSSVLTLVTTAGSGLVGALDPSHIVYVDASLTGNAATPPSGRLIAVPSAELPGQSDPSSWPFVIFWLQALLIAGCGIAWLWSRWGRWQTWLVGVPVLVALLWGLSTEAMRLLPNIM